MQHLVAHLCIKPNVYFFSSQSLNNGETTKELTIHFERADKGLGLSIAGGLGSTPYKDNDEGIFISRVTAGGPADIAGLKKDDKVLAVNGHNCVGIDHYEAVTILKNAGKFKRGLLVLFSRRYLLQTMRFNDFICNEMAF